MFITNVSFSGVSSINSVKKSPVTSVSLKHDTFEKSAYNPQNFTAQLESYKDKKGKPVYNKQHITEIVGNVNKNPEKYDAIRNMAALPNTKGKELVKLSMLNVDKLNVLNEYALTKNNKGTAKYSGNQILKLSSLTVPDLQRVKPLSNTTLRADQIVGISADKNLNIEKLSKKVNEMENACGKLTLDKVSFKKDVYDPENAYVLTGTMITGREKSELLDKNLNRLAISETTTYTSDKNKEYIITKTNDYRNNTTSKVRSYVDKDGYPIVENQVRIVRDKNGKVQKTEYMAPSEVKGVFDIKYVYPNGKEEQISSGKIDKKTGIVSVKRDMKSLDGTRTEYLYENDPQGNRIIDYKITDENGKQLLKYSQTLEVIDDNKFITSKNDKSYEVSVSQDKNIMTVKDLKTEKENKLNLGSMLRGDKVSMLNLLKKFPGEELIALKDVTNILKGMKKMDDCCYWPDKKEIDVVDDLYSVLHELGHAKDYKNGGHGITAKKDVQEVFDKERNAFNKAFPNAQREHINYFIDVEEHYSGFRGGLEETVAESNALLNSYNGELDIAARSQYLQQYFPKTIAKLAEHLYNT